MLKELLKAQFDELVKKLRNTPDGVEAKKLYLQIEALAKTLNITLPSEIKPIVTGEKKGDGECQEPTPSPSPSAGGGLFSLPNLLLAAGAGLFLTGTRGVLPLGLLGAGAFMKFKSGVTGINGPRKLTAFDAIDEALKNGYDLQKDYHAFRKAEQDYFYDLMQRSRYTAPPPSKRSGSPVRYFYYHLQKKYS